ncbi:hypothetical protein LEMLEM_LOCUS12747 [Lemmus lemmus]
MLGGAYLASRGTSLETPSLVLLSQDCQRHQLQGSGFLLKVPQPHDDDRRALGSGGPDHQGHSLQGDRPGEPRPQEHQ